MTSSRKELLDAFEPLINIGKLGIIPDLEEEKGCNVLYNKMTTLDKVLSPKELLSLPCSGKEQEARKNGCKTNEEICEYIEKINKEKKKEAIEIGKAVICDTIGMFSCKDAHEECSWDMVYEFITPNGDFLYIRQHCY